MKRRKKNIFVWNKKKRRRQKEEERQEEERPKERKVRPKETMLKFILPGVYFAILSIGLSLTLTGLTMFENVDKEVIKYLYMSVGIMIMFFSIPFLMLYGSKIKKSS